MQENGSLTAKQEQAIASLIAGKTTADVAHILHVNESTIYRWKRSQEWKTAFSAAEQDVVDQALSRLTRYGNAAVDTLARNLVNDTGVPASIRRVQVMAALGIIGTIIQIRKMSQLEDEIEQLRQALAQGQDDGPWQA